MKIAIIGSSGHWSYATEGMPHFPEAKWVGLAPGSADESMQALEKHIPRAVPRFADYRSMLDKQQPEVAVINPQFHRHAEVLEACIQRGIHCYVEKPVCFEHKQLRRLRKLWQQQQAVKMASMMAYRFHPAFVALAKAVEEGAVGTPLLISAQKSYKLGRRPEWMHQRERFGGLILWVGIHAIDWIYWLLGPIFEEVKAYHTTEGNHGHGELESAATCLFKLRGGAQAHVHMDYFRPAKATTHGDDRLRVAGELGIVEIIDEQAILTTHEQPPTVLTPEKQPQLFADFLEHVATDKPYRLSPEAVFDVTDLCISARDSADSGKAQKIR